MSEEVLVFPAEVMGKLPPFDKFTQDTNIVNAYFHEWIRKDVLRFMDRKQAEVDPSFKQVIPYCVIASTDNKYFVYERSKKGGESRLHNLLSVGTGGHINPIDGHSANVTTYYKALCRELKEELGIVVESYEAIPYGLLYDPSNEVGKVHFGVVHCIVVSNANRDIIHNTEETFANFKWMERKELWQEFDKFENWSKLVITYLLPN